MEHDNIGYVNLVGNNGLFVAYKVIFLKAHMLVTAHPGILPHLRKSTCNNRLSLYVAGQRRIQNSVKHLRRSFFAKIFSQKN